MYPVYFPGREPEGYWKMLQQHIGPKPLIAPEKLKTADWIKAGRRVFLDWEKAQMRTLIPS